MNNGIARRSIIVGLVIATITIAIAFVWTGRDGDHAGFDTLVIGLAAVLNFSGGAALTAIVLVFTSKNTLRKTSKIVNILLALAALILVLHLTHFIG